MKIKDFADVLSDNGKHKVYGFYSKPYDSLVFRIDKGTSRDLVMYVKDYD